MLGAPVGLPSSLFRALDHAPWLLSKTVKRSERFGLRLAFAERCFPRGQMDITGSLNACDATVKNILAVCAAGLVDGLLVLGAIEEARHTPNPFDDHPLNAVPATNPDVMQGVMMSETRLPMPVR